MHYPDDNSLIKALKSRDDEAFRVFVDRYRDSVTRVAIGFTGNRDDAEDVAQDVFLEVYRSIDKFRQRAALSTWLYRIAVNRSLNFIRRASRKRVVPFTGQYGDGNDRFEQQDPAGNPNSSDSPEEEMGRAEMAAALDSALAMLPDNQRTAFVLHRYEDLSYKEIAVIMKRSVGSVESLIFRARQGLQKSLYKFYRENIG